MNRLEVFFFKGFLVSVFFVHYELNFVPLTLHSIFLLLGLVLMSIKELHIFTFKNSKISYDVLAVFGLGTIMVLGYLCNLRTATFSNLQAYILGLLCYVYVKNYTHHLSHGWFFNLLKLFLISNSILTILQFSTGSFYPASYFAAGNPPLALPSGWADGPTKNGMLVVFALSVIVGLTSFKKSKYVFIDVLILLISIPALLVTVSRSSIGAFVLVVIFNYVLILIYISRKKKLNFKGIRLVLVLFLFFMFIAQKVGVLDVIEIYANSDSDNNSSKVILHKLTNWQDDSLGERIENNQVVNRIFMDNPLSFLLFGIGLGSFEVVNGINIHNSYLEIFIQTGLFGSLFFCYLLVFIFIKVFKSANDSRLIPIFLGLLSIMIFMGFHDVLRGRIFWIPFGMLAFYSKF